MKQTFTASDGSVHLLFTGFQTPRYYPFMLTEEQICKVYWLMKAGNAKALEDYEDRLYIERGLAKQAQPAPDAPGEG